MPVPKIDWLSITILYRKGAHIDEENKLDLNTVLHLLKMEDESNGFIPMKGIHRYQARYSYHGITINEPSPDRLIGDGTQERSGMGYNVSMSGNGLIYYQSKQEAKDKNFDFRRFLRSLMNHSLYEIHCSRIDIAIDDAVKNDDRDKKLLLDLDRIKEYADSGRIKTKIRNMDVTETRRYKLRKDSDTGFCKPEPSGRTIYFGSRKSEKYIRVYDKLAEQLQKNPNDKDLKETSCWTRFEVEYKGNTAGEILKMYILPTKDWEERYLSHVRDLLNFLDGEETASWWEQFCKSLEPVHLYVRRKHTDTSDFVHMRDNFFKKMGRNGLTVMLGQGPRKFFSTLVENAIRLKRRHYSVLKGYCQDMQLDGKRGFKLIPELKDGCSEQLTFQEQELSFDFHSVDFLRESSRAIRETREELNDFSGTFRHDPRFEVSHEEIAEMLYRLGVNDRQWR